MNYICSGFSSPEQMRRAIDSSPAKIQTARPAVQNLLMALEHGKIFTHSSAFHLILLRVQNINIYYYVIFQEALGNGKVESCCLNMLAFQSLFKILSM